MTLIVRVVVPVWQAELAADALWRTGATAVGEDTNEGSVALLASFVDDDTARNAVGQLTSFGEAGVEVGLDVVADGWQDQWREHARAVRAGRRIVVRPAWVHDANDDVGLTDDDLVLDIEAGRTFGYGAHATTRLVLAMIEDLVVAGARVLDLGCGSGVLAIAAARLGASAVTGIDLDREAVDVTMANARQNGVEHIVTSSDDEFAAVDGPFDLVVANVLAPVIVGCAADVARVIRPGGVLVVSGLLMDRWQHVEDALAGFTLMERRVLGGWCALALRRDLTRTPARPITMVTNASAW